MYEGSIYLAIAIVVFVIIALIAWWMMGVYNVNYPGPARPDANFSDMLSEFQSYPKELWFRFNPCKFDEYLDCSALRFIVFESNGIVVYDSAKSEKWEGWGGPYENAKQLNRSLEYDRACTLTQGAAIRGKVDNLAELVKRGDRYRIVHMSRYIFDRTDLAF